MILKEFIDEYIKIIKTDGIVSKIELIDMMKLDEALSGDNKKDEILSKLADKILNNIFAKIELKELKKPKIKIDRMALYNQGLSDYAISEIEGVYPSTIWHWRNVNILQSNERLQRAELDKKRMKFYKQGLDDDEIAKKIYATRTSIYKWRVRNGLPINKKIGGTSK